MRGMARFYRSELNKLESDGKIVKRDGLKIYLDSYDGRDGWYRVRIWHGNRAENTSDYIYPNLEKASKAIEDACEGARATATFKAKMKAERAIVLVPERRSVRIHPCPGWDLFLDREVDAVRSILHIGVLHFGGASQAFP